MVNVYVYDCDECGLPHCELPLFFGNADSPALKAIPDDLWMEYQLAEAAMIRLARRIEEEGQHTYAYLAHLKQEKAKTREDARNKRAMRAFEPSPEAKASPFPPLWVKEQED